MSRKQKQRETLSLLESDFHESLIRALVPAVNDSHSQLFLAEAFNQYPILRGRTDSVTDQLVDAAEQIRELRLLLGESIECESSLFVSYCQTFCDVSNENRVGVRKHSASLLDEISSLRRK